MIKYFSYAAIWAVFIIVLVVLIGQFSGTHVEGTGVTFVFDKQDELDELSERLSNRGLIGDDIKRYEELKEEQYRVMDEVGRILIENKGKDCHELSQISNLVRCVEKYN